MTGRFYDPLRVRRELFRLTGNRFNDWVTKRTPETDADLIPAVRAALGLADIDAQTGGGFTDAVVIDALDLFTEYVAGKAPTVQTSPTSAPCTECP